MTSPRQKEWEFSERSERTERSERQIEYAHTVPGGVGGLKSAATSRSLGNRG